VSRTVKAHILLVLTALVWGATFVQIKDALRQASPLLFNAVRMSLAAIVLAIIYAPQLKRMNRAAFASGVMVGIFLCLGYELQTTGLQYTTPAKSAFLTGLSVVLVPLFIALLSRKPVRAWTVAGVLAALAGLYLLSVPQGQGSLLGDFQSVNRGDLLTMGCAISFTFQIIFVGRASARHSFEAIAALQSATAACLMIITAPILEQPHITWSVRVVAAILVTGLLGTAAAFTIQTWAQQFISPTNTALIFALEPVFAWLVSYLFLGERLGWRGAGGALLILFGLLSSELLGKAGPVHAPEP